MSIGKVGLTPAEAAQLLTKEEASLLLAAEIGLSEVQAFLLGGLPVVEGLVDMQLLQYLKQLGLWCLTPKGRLVALELCGLSQEHIN